MVKRVHQEHPDPRVRPDKMEGMDSMAEGMERTVAMVIPGETGKMEKTEPLDLLEKMVETVIQDQ
jgi:hypothetical protein